MNFKKQISIFITASVLVGFISNLVRSDAISWIAEPIKVVKNVDDVLLILSDSQIREIDLETAKSLHQTGLLFVDARAEEYLPDGMIPGAIANDDVGILSEQIEFLVGYEKGFVVDRKSTRLNSSHKPTSYAVFCLKKKISGMPSAVR